MEFMPGPPLNGNEDYFTYGPPNFNQNTEPPIDYSAKRNETFNNKYGEYKPADYFNDALSEGELGKDRLPDTGSFLDINNSIPEGAPENLKNLMRGLQGQEMTFNSRNVTNGVGFNNDSDYFKVGQGYIELGGQDGKFKFSPGDISGTIREGQTGLSGKFSFNPGFNGAPERASGGVRYMSPDRNFEVGVGGSVEEGKNSTLEGDIGYTNKSGGRFTAKGGYDGQLLNGGVTYTSPNGRFNAGVNGTAGLQGQRPTVRGNIGYRGENGEISAGGGIDAQGAPDVRVDFKAGQPQLSKEEIALKKGMVSSQITDALNPNPNVSPQLPPQMTGEPLSPGRQFAMEYINKNFGGELRKGGSSLLY